MRLRGWCVAPSQEAMGRCASRLTVALPGGGAAEHGGELRGHVRSIAEVESGRRVARVGRLLVRAPRKVGATGGEILVKFYLGRRNALRRVGRRAMANV